MNCPVCNLALTMTERQGVEIDYCPKCRGVWLDRGELDKIIERSMVGNAPQQSQGGTQYNAPHDSNYDNRPQHFDNQHQYKQHNDHQYKKKKKESFLGELFDF